MTEFFVCLGRDGALRRLDAAARRPYLRRILSCALLPNLSDFLGSATAPLSSEALAKAEVAPVGVSPTESTIRVGSPFG